MYKCNIDNKVIERYNFCKLISIAVALKIVYGLSGGGGPKSRPLRNSHLDIAFDGCNLNYLKNEMFFKSNWTKGPPCVSKDPHNLSALSVVSRLGTTADTDA